MHKLQPTIIKVARQRALLVGINQDFVSDGQYLTQVYVRGRIHNVSAYMTLSDTPIEALNGQSAYLTDADTLDRTSSGELLFEYEFTLRSRLPYISVYNDDDEEAAYEHCAKYFD